MQVSQEKKFWEAFLNQGIQQAVVSIEPKLKTICVDDAYLDIVALAFADIIDAKSPFTYDHSKRVAGYADALAERMGIPAERRRWLYRGALLRDIGKLGVSNAILDKPGKLTDEEFALVKLHTKYTEEILSKISLFKEMAMIAGAHHERLDGKGYHKGLQGDQICLETRILTLADIYGALTAKRPYREAMPAEIAMGILMDMQGTAIDGNCLDAFKTVVK